MRFVAGRGADKVCCWQGRCGEAVAGRGPSAQRTAGRDAAAKSHREDVAGRKCHGGAAGRECHSEEDGGTVAESHREDVAGRGAVAKLLPAGIRRHRGLPAGALQRRAIGKQARKEPLLQAGKEPPRAASEQKRERQNPLS